jgi:GTP-binding protein EngB required for normal cell division
MADLQRALEHVDAAVAAAETVLGPEALDEPMRRLARARERVRFLGDSVVVALVGGTGSGKSSLLNALAGREVVTAGAIRPTTEEPVAWVPRGAEPSLGRLLDTYGIDRRVPHDDGGRLAVVDLPDLDSVELAHHATVDALLPRIDLAVWVLDPQKYNDRSMHDRIAARARYAASFLFVLNRVDGLRGDDVALVVEDLEGTLRADGIDDPTVLVTAADPPAGPPQGIDELRSLLDARVADKGLAIGKLRQDVLALVETLEASLEAGTTAPGGLEETWDAARDQAASAAAEVLVDGPAVASAARAGARTAVTRGSGPAGRLWHALRRSPVGRAAGAPADVPSGAGGWALGDVRNATERAGATLSRALVDASRALPGPAGARLRGDLPPETVDRHVREAIEAARTATPAPPEPRRGVWVAGAVLQTLLTLVVVAGAVWWWAEPTAVQPGDWPWPALLVAGGVVLAFVMSRSLRASGAAAGRRAALAHREALATAIGERLERRLGAPVRAAAEALRTVGSALDDARAAVAD